MGSVYGLALDAGICTHSLCAIPCDGFLYARIATLVCDAQPERKVTEGTDLAVQPRTCRALIC